MITNLFYVTKLNFWGAKEQRRQLEVIYYLRYPNFKSFIPLVPSSIIISELLFTIWRSWRPLFLINYLLILRLFHFLLKLFILIQWIIRSQRTCRKQVTGVSAKCDIVLSYYISACSFLKRPNPSPEFVPSVLCSGTSVSNPGIEQSGCQSLFPSDHTSVFSSRYPAE